jgi:hypothetical protein
MALPFQDRFGFLRGVPRERGSRGGHSFITWLPLLLTLGIGCVGGQTGTEATDDDRGGSGTSNGGTPAIGSDASAGSEGTASPDAPSDGSTSSETCVALSESDGERIQRALERASSSLNALDPTQIIDQSGATEDVLLSLRDAGAACEAPIGGGPSELRIDVTIQLAAKDGSFLLALPGTVQFTNGADGSLLKLELSGSLHCSGAPGSSAMLPCSWGTFDAQRYAAALLKLDVTVQSVVPQAQLLGSLSTYVREAPCGDGACGVASEPMTVMVLTGP